MSAAAHRWVVLAALALGASGCGGGGAAEVGAGGDGSAGAEAPPEPTGPVEPLTVLPPDSLAVARVDLERLRESPHADAIPRWVAVGSKQAGVDAEGERLHQEVVDATHVAVVAAAPPDEGHDEPPVVVVLRGDFPEGLLERWLRNEAGDELTVQARGEHRVFVSPEGQAVALDEQTWILATPSRFDAALSRAEDRSGRSPLAQPPLRAMAERIEFGETAISLVARPTEELRARYARRAPVDRELLESIELLGVRLDAAEGVEGEAVAEATDAEAARGLARFVESSRRRFGGNMFVRMLGFDVLFDATRARAEGDTAVATISLGEAETRELLGQLERLAKMISGGEGGGFRIQFGGSTSSSTDSSKGP